jgi:hypothetical protein
MLILSGGRRTGDWLEREREKSRGKEEMRDETLSLVQK